MAISKNLWLDGAKQKLAGAVTYTLKGQQIIRKEAPQVANPRTTAQMNQRVRLANLVNFYRANVSWMKRGAFENKKQTQSDYNAFVSRNIQTSNIALTKAEALAGAVIADTYQVTDGSLPMANVTINGRIALLNVTGVLQEDGANIVDFVESIIDAYPGVRMGDQMSIIALINKRDSNGIPRLQVKAYEMVLKLYGDERDQGNPNALIANGSDDVAITSQNGGYGISVTAAIDAVIGYAICFSRTTSTGIKVSPSFVVLSDTTFKTGYSSEEQFQKAINSYGESAANFLDSTSVVAGDSNTSSGGSDQGGSGAGDPGDVTP